LNKPIKNVVIASVPAIMNVTLLITNSLRMIDWYYFCLFDNIVIKSLCVLFIRGGLLLDFGMNTYFTHENLNTKYKLELPIARDRIHKARESQTRYEGSCSALLLFLMNLLVSILMTNNPEPY